MQRLKICFTAAALGAGLICAIATFGQDTQPMEEIQKYRQMLEEANPAELLELAGEAVWTTPRGPKQATLQQCDLGLGPGKLDGAYAKLPRYFPDTGKVQDVESRLVTCMMTLQGMTLGDATRGWYKRESDMEALVTYVATQSKGHQIDVPAALPQEARMYEAGREIFWRRSGPLDFGCATCHSQKDRRIRLQDLPDFLDAQSAQASMVTWPAYRVSQTAVWTMERRLIDCIRQMRWPEPAYLSDMLVALQVYLQKTANGGVMQAPGIKR